MTLLATAAAASAILSYFLRRTAKPENALQTNIANGLSFLTIAFVCTYFYLRFAS